MRKNLLLKLPALLLLITVSNVLQAQVKNEPRALYTYSFGGIEKMKVRDAVNMLDDLGYAGIAVEARGQESLDRMDEFYKSSEKKEGFEVTAAFMAHRLGKYGFSDAAHKAAIDRLAGKKNATIWIWVRDDLQDGSITDAKVEKFLRGIAEYAISNDVKVVLYPHYNTYYPTADDLLPLVEKIDHPSCGVAINLCHELMSDKGDALEQTFKNAKGRIGAVIISGALIKLDRKSVGTMNASTIKSLDDSQYDLRPYLRLVKESDYQGPVGFINFKLSKPENYLKRTMKRWQELCEEVGLYE